MLNAASPVLRLTRAGETVWGPLPGDNEQNEWSVFESNHSTYEPLSWAHNNTGYSVEDVKPVPLTTVVQVRTILSFFFFFHLFANVYVFKLLFHKKVLDYNPFHHFREKIH